MIRSLVSAVAMALLLGGAPSASVGVSAPADVCVREDHGLFIVETTWSVPQAPPAVLAVLTDYERIPEFMPGVTRSTVLERTAGRAVVEQDAVSRFMFFTKQIHLDLEITERPDALLFRDRSHRSFSRYEGSWRILSARGGSDIRYALEARPTFDVPASVLSHLLKRDSSRMITALSAEIASRAIPRR
jgi:ribosome-associated toxin RatA of RatAB toxin-antitoxin module